MCDLLVQANPIYIYSPTSSQTSLQYNSPTNLSIKDPIC